jgi:kynurenine formamidase
LLISIHIQGKTYQVDPANAIDLAIPLRFDGEQPTIFGAERAVSMAVEAGALAGDTRRGGSCNFEQYTFIPHCNGTHTESVGHITNERISVLDSLKDVFILARLITVDPENALESGESYPVEFEPEDRLITRRALEAKKLPANAGSSDSALIVRTLPNDESKLVRDYSEDPAPFFSVEAMQYIVEFGVRHLLVDMPSIDRMYDEGKLSNHRIFWNVEAGSFEVSKESRVNCTVTEMIYVPATVQDGQYLLNLQVPAFVTDAAPSRPIIFEFK